MPTRFTPDNPCPICGGNDRDPRGAEQRCWGFLTDDRQYVHCMRPQYAGALLPHAKTQAYVHKNGACLCGKSHEWAGAPPVERPTKITREYDYRDEEGAVLFQIARFANGGRAAHRPGQYAKGQWNITGVRRVLYRLPDLLHADPDRRVFVTEGEKDAERLAGLGFVATSPPFGAHAKWTDHPEFSKVLRGRHVVVCPDNDEAGHKHAHEVATCLAGVAAEVRLLTFEGVGPKGDVSDWLDMGHTREDLESLVRRTPAWTPSEPLQQPLSNGNGHHKDQDALVITQVTAARGAPSDALPFVSLADMLARPRTPVQFLVKDILVAQEATLISGMERSFKSFFAMEMAVCCAAGLPFLGTIPTTPARIALIDLENRRERLCDRLAASLARKNLGEGETREIAARFLVFDRENAPRFYLNTVSLARLEKSIEHFEPTLIILDNLTKGLPPGTDQNLNNEMQPLIDALVTMTEDRKIALIVCDHDTKAGGMASGAGTKLRLIGNVLHVIHDRRTRLSMVTCSSLRNADPFAPFGITVDKTGVLIPVALPESNDGGPDRLIREGLRTGALTAKEFADATGTSEKTARQMLEAAALRGLVHRLEDRANGKRGPKALRYGLADHAPDGHSAPVADIVQQAYSIIDDLSDPSHE